MRTDIAKRHPAHQTNYSFLLKCIIGVSTTLLAAAAYLALTAKTNAGLMASAVVINHSILLSTLVVLGGGLLLTAGILALAIYACRHSEPVYVANRPRQGFFSFTSVPVYPATYQAHVPAQPQSFTHTHGHLPQSAHHHGHTAPPPYSTDSHSHGHDHLGHPHGHGRGF
ncbi:Uncharacterised protein (plasmid) [Legionella adelaidensis]|uniref:Transmembrane protein n=1 Tax=Legionella adelaidensis TaxID=45056 RepID=A0A0W0R348_9GAMM|nr:hypothetical protein [Legionella adelaidensis]KTC65494.1 hypothetical protein Lade_0152 [Legionella adelaidensis]VEH84685.1 Uncharacterised protein [Legionella adelaidensis]